MKLWLSDYGINHSLASAMCLVMRGVSSQWTYTRLATAQETAGVRDTVLRAARQYDVKGVG